MKWTLNSTAVLSASVVGMAIWLQYFLEATDEPSFINCLTYVPDGQQNFLAFGAIVSGLATTIMSLLARRSVIVFLEGLGLVLVAYFAAVFASASGAALNQFAFGQILFGITFFAILLIAILRHDLRKLFDQELPK